MFMTYSGARGASLVARWLTLTALGHERAWRVLTKQIAPYLTVTKNVIGKLE
jgi:hypothetical protein